MSLDESLKAFEEGVGLVRGAQKSLQSAKSRIEILTQEGQNETFDQFIEQELNSRDIPKPLRSALLYSLQGGKRLRGHLTYACALAWGGSEDVALRLALAAEAAHTCGLVHDDLPAMDNDLLRRGKPTVHAKYGESMAILVGDALMSLTFELIVSTEHEHVGQMCWVAAKAVGPEGMMAGQHMDFTRSKHLKRNCLTCMLIKQVSYLRCAWALVCCATVPMQVKISGKWGDS